MNDMNTPICSFVEKYASSGLMRMHMPGHKGLGSASESCDITEIEGADSLYEADGIIRESERNAGSLFGAQTFYSAEGSSLAIRAMLALVTIYAGSMGKKPLIAAGRNAHKVFISAAALLDFDTEWLAPDDGTYLNCPVTAEYLAQYLDNAPVLPTAVYLTSPDYAGNMLDIERIAQVCHARGVLLTVDNAHGAYMKFLPQSCHPIDLGVDMCCDSAHKTLPVLTGGAYLHISENTAPMFAQRAKQALAMFGSTSPSYLILASLDRANACIANGYSERLRCTVDRLNSLKCRLQEYGYTITGDEPMKLTILPKACGYTGAELAAYLTGNGIIPEFSDPDMLVLMPSAETTEAELARLERVLLSLQRRSSIPETSPPVHIPQRVMSPREAMLSDAQLIPADECAGRVIAAVTVGCPPAVPIIVPGERADRKVLELLRYYGVKTCSVIR